MSLKIEVMKVMCKNCNNAHVRVDTAERCISFDEDLTRSKCSVRSCMNCVHRNTDPMEDIIS